MSFASRVNKERHANKVFNEGIEALKALKANYKDTILELYMISYDDRERSVKNYMETRSVEEIGQYLPSSLKGMESGKIKQLAELFSVFIPSNKNMFIPFKDSERSDNLIEEIYRFKATYSKVKTTLTEVYEKLGWNQMFESQKRTDAFMTDIEITLANFHAREWAIRYRNRNIKEGNYLELLDKATEGIGKRLQYLLLSPEQSITLGGMTINTRELGNRTDALLKDIERFRNSEAGQAVLNFSSEQKRHT